MFALSLKFAFGWKLKMLAQVTTEAAAPVCVKVVGVTSYSTLSSAKPK